MVIEERAAARPAADTPRLRFADLPHLRSARVTWVTGIGLLLFSSAVVALYIGLFAPLLYAYVGDSSAYIEAARSAAAGEPLLYSVPYGYAAEMQIFRLWPPGYPVLIAAVASLGADAAPVALWLTRVSVWLLPITAFWAIRPAVGLPLAVAAALLSFTSPGILPDAHNTSSDPTYLVFATLSFGVFLRGVATEPSARRSSLLLALAGLLCAFSVCIRNGGLALIPAEAATIAVLSFAGGASFVQFFRRGLSFGVGLAIGLLPLVIWNMAAFGVLRPYEMAPSTVGVARNIHDLVAAVVFDLMPGIRPGALTMGVAVLSLAGVCALVVIGVLQIRRANVLRAQRIANDPLLADGSSEARGAFLILAACFGLAMALMTVAARSRYEWGEFITSRHVAPFDWLLLTAAIAALAAHVKQRRALLGGAFAVTAGLLVCRAGEVAASYARITAPIAENPGALSAVERSAIAPLHERFAMLAFSRSARVAALVNQVPRDCDIISNAATVVTIEHKRRARQLWETPPSLAAFASGKKPGVLIFLATPFQAIDGLQPPSPAYRTIRDPLFVAFVPPACEPGAAAP
jgi:hypothetical protein